ncbi:hypothetical protein ACKVWC_004145 [Pyricularia oryzae]
MGLWHADRHSEKSVMDQATVRSVDRWMHQRTGTRMASRCITQYQKCPVVFRSGSKALRSVCIRPTIAIDLPTSAISLASKLGEDRGGPYAMRPNQYTPHLDAHPNAPRKINNEFEMLGAPAPATQPLVRI